MNHAKQGDTVKIHYTGTLDDGSQFDSSAGREPMEFTLGMGTVIQGFDKAVEGMSIGETKSVNIAPDDAYGPHHNELVHKVPRSSLPEDIEPTEGMALQAQGEDGQIFNLTVIADSQVPPIC